ncbi:MAG: M20/M25/M40 family metallo-hydrolase [Firmicutes bacterium]|nr:M20/M25/M40 family metallo-hydrolase [Bacillota bacterium]
MSQGRPGGPTCPGRPTGGSWSRTGGGPVARSQARGWSERRRLDVALSLSLAGSRRLRLAGAIGRHVDVARVLPDEPFEVSVSGDSPPFLLDQERPVYRLVCDEMGDHETHTVAFATDAGWLQTKGYDCVIWGPGSIAVAHKPNEAIPVAELRVGARRLERVVQRACIEGTV